MKIFEKKAIFPVKKLIWPIFSRIIQYDKRHGTVYKGTQGFLASFVQMIKSFFWELRGRQKQTFQTREVFTVTKVIDQFFLVISSVTNLKEQFVGVHKVF